MKQELLGVLSCIHELVSDYYTLSVNLTEKKQSEDYPAARKPTAMRPPPAREAFELVLRKARREAVAVSPPRA